SLEPVEILDAAHIDRVVVDPIREIQRLLVDAQDAALNLDVVRPTHRRRRLHRLPTPTVLAAHARAGAGPRLLWRAKEILVGRTLQRAGRVRVEGESCLPLAAALGSGVSHPT